MKYVLFPLLLILSGLVQAEVIRSTINSIDLSEEGEEALLLLDNGRVVFVEDESLLMDKNLLGAAVEVEASEDNRLISIQSIPEEALPQQEEFLESPAEEETPTIFPNEAAATKIFNDFNTSWKSQTECTDRAHIWAYEEWKEHGMISQKVFMFFTNTYIRRYNYHWWFHVSPYSLVQNGDEVVERVMDRRYSRRILSMKNWSDIFIRSRKACPETTYRHYRQNKNGPEHCFHVKSAMYYRLPLHVRGLEDQGIKKTRFNTSEVNFSYRAFTRRGSK